MTTSTLKEMGINVGTLTRWATLADAKGFAASFAVIRLVVMGCDGCYWVVSAKEAARLRTAGYEMA